MGTSIVDIEFDLHIRDAVWTSSLLPEEKRIRPRLKVERNESAHWCSEIRTSQGRDQSADCKP